MYPDSLLLWWPAQWCLWDFLPISGTYNSQFVLEAHKEQHVSLQKIKKSRGNTCVLFPSYRHFNGFTSCFRQLLSAVMKLPVLLLSSWQAIQILASALLARSVLAPLTSFPLVVFIFITFPASSRCHSRCLSRWCTLPSPPTLRADVRRYFKTYLSSKEKDC